jgi:hypothetical protein
MPRRSTDALAIVSLSPDRSRLVPPPELGEAEAKVFRETIAAVRIDHFQAEDLPLLCAYARAVVLERRAAQELAIAATVGNVASPWLAVHTQMARTVMQLTVRLRIGPRSRDHHTRSAKAGPQPSAYDSLPPWGTP